VRFVRVDRLSLRFSGSIAILILACQAASFFAVYRYASGRLLEASRQQATLATRLVHQALEDGMLKNDDRLLKEMVEGFAAEQGVERVMILNREGVVRFSSDPAIRERHFDQSSPTCQVCHLKTPADRGHSATLAVNGGRTLRVVDPINNRQACFPCHSNAHRINGLVVVDMPLDPALASLRAAIGDLAVFSTLAGMSLLIGTGLVFRRMMMRRLIRFERTARAIAQGDLSQRLRVVGNDALTRVERQFNVMADAVSALLGQLRQRQTELERVMNSVDDGMVVLDQNRIVVAANEAFARRFCGGEEETVGLACCCERAGAGSTAGEGAACPTLACFLTGRVQTAVKRRTLPDGTVRHEEVRASPVLAEDGRVSHVVEVWRDITDRRSAEARLADTERLASLGMLASGFSHEVNTPLGSIGMCLEGIKRICASPGGISPQDRLQLAEYTRTGAAQVHRAGAITEQFLRLSRGQSLPCTALDLETCADVVVGLCRHKAQSAGVTVDVIPADREITVAANESAVQQVLLNLVLNAIDASGQGQRITITFEVDQRGSVVRVADQGRGIPPEDLPRIFEPFFSRRAGGTGLGLFVSLNFARGWEGDIIAESRTGDGTVFSVVFPRDQEDRPHYATDQGSRS